MQRNYDVKNGRLMKGKIEDRGRKNGRSMKGNIEYRARSDEGGMKCSSGIMTCRNG